MISRWSITHQDTCQRGYSGDPSRHRRQECRRISAPPWKRQGLWPKAPELHLSGGRRRHCRSPWPSRTFLRRRTNLRRSRRHIIETNIRHAVETFKRQKRGAKILLKEVPDAERFGVAEIRGDYVIGIEEKPRAPKSNFAVIGIYLYDATVFEKIHRLKPSGRGELEITDVNNFYVQEGSLTYETLGGWWTDAGTFESLLRANNLVAKTGANKLSDTNEGATAIKQEFAR